MQFNVITINSTASIPLFRYLINHFVNVMNVPVDITEINVKEYHNYYSNSENVSFNIISEYTTYQDFMTQSKVSKIKKYVSIIKKVLKIYRTKQKQVIYTNDYQVLYCILLSRLIYGNKRIQIVYHQFELIEKSKLNRVNKYLYGYILKRANKINLAIFPEINRLNYFLNESNLDKNNTFLMPNSCETTLHNSSTKKHKLFNQFPPNSFIVAHIGHVGGNNFYLSEFLSAIEVLASNKSIQFLFLGRQTQGFKNLITEKKMENIVLVDNVPHTELEQIYPFIDLGVILYKATNLNTEFCAPNKLYELWSNSIPVIGHRLKGLNPIFDIEEKGLLTNFENIDAIVKSILNFSNSSINKKKLTKEFENKLSISKHLILLQKRIEDINLS